MLMTQVEKDQRNKALPPLGNRALALALEWVETLWLHMWRFWRWIALGKMSRRVHHKPICQKVWRCSDCCRNVMDGGETLWKGSLPESDRLICSSDLWSLDSSVALFWLFRLIQLSDRRWEGCLRRSPAPESTVNFICLKCLLGVVCLNFCFSLSPSCVSMFCAVRVDSSRVHSHSHKWGVDDYSKCTN